MVSVGAQPFTPLVEVGIATRPLAGQRESGDGYVFQPFPAGVLMGAVDGLGHGDEAARAARAAVAVLEQHAHESVLSLVRRCHRALVGTRGAAMSLASLHYSSERLTWLGIGNVEGVVVRTGEAPSTSSGQAVTPRPQWLLLQGGVVGYSLPPLRLATLPLTAGDTLIFATDGVRSGFLEGLREGVPPQQLADWVLARYGKATDDALVLVVRWLGTGRRRESL